MTQDIINNIRWQDIFDILLMSYILFRLYVLFKGTNVFRVLMSFAVLWFFLKVVLHMGLIVTGAVVQEFTVIAPIIIIVIFRNEIRAVLQAKNFKAILWDAPHYDVETPADIIAESVFEMAYRGTGSIIVILGKEDLFDSVHSGINWDGKISKEMIKSIFWHENPVHDGAVIAKGNRIAQVGAVLPLTHRKDIPTYYGMRHRAAIGLAEASDALVIVSSEERKNVIVARGEDVTGVKNRDELVTHINDHLGITEKGHSGYKKQSFELAITALVSLVLITGIWLSFTRGIDTYMTLEVPIEYTNSNQEIIVMETSVKNVSLDLSGSGRLLKNLVSGQVKVGIDLSTGGIGRNIYNITMDNITLPPGVFLRNTTPSSVDIVLDKVVEKYLPIQVSWKGKLDEDLLVSRVSFSPAMAVISGPSLILEDILTVYTDEIPIDNIKKTGKMDVSLDLVNNKLKIENGTNGRFTMEYLIANRDKTDDEI